MFKGRVALVTGASRGIGKEIALELMRQGANVYVNSRSLIHAQASCSDLSGKEKAGKCFPIAADVSNREEVEAMVNQIIKEKGKIDFLINNAGLVSRSSLFDITDEHWNEVLNVNLRGVFLCTQIVSRNMVRKKFGRIVNAASYAAWRATLNRGVYAAAKAGIIALTKVWAGELAPFGITINAYAPGDIDTEMMKDIRGANRKRLIERIALHRFGTPEEVGRVVTFLLSPSANYLTGVVIEISGGKLTVQNPGDAWKRLRDQ